MKFKYGPLILSAILLTGAVGTASFADDMMKINQATYNADGSVQAPKIADFRMWVFVGAPLTPNALNDGNAAFQEFHNVYVEPSAFKHFSKTGEWANGTQIVKELTYVRKGDDCDDATGACFEVSGNGYFQGEFSGMELTIKDTKRFSSEPGGWVYFSFGHHAPPYAESAKAFPAASCNSCHEGNAENDFVFTQFYPVIRAVDPKK